MYQDSGMMRYGHDNTTNFEQIEHGYSMDTETFINKHNYICINTCTRYKYDMIWCTMPI